MPRLILMRHAKSSWAEPDRDDFDRPLAPRGRKTAVAVARALAARRLLPQRLVASSARRSRDTLAAMLPFLDDDADIRLTRDLYMTSEDHHIDVIRASGGGARALMLIGHNPSLQDLALVLAGTGAAREALRKDFPTAAVAIIDFATPRWTDIEPGEGELAAFLTPHGLKHERA
jgi:phosphohistidine phosphatase